MSDHMPSTARELLMEMKLVLLHPKPFHWQQLQQMQLQYLQLQLHY